MFIYLAALAGLALLTSGCQDQDLPPPQYPSEKTPLPSNVSEATPSVDPGTDVPAEENPLCPGGSLPEIVILDEFHEFKVTPKKIRDDLHLLQKLNPRFLCNLNRIQVMKFKNWMNNPCHAPDDVIAGCYQPANHTIYLQDEFYFSGVLFHEVGHHVDISLSHYHGFEPWEKILTEFRPLGWRLTPDPRDQTTKGRGDERFVSWYATTNPEEDFAETFEIAVLQALGENEMAASISNASATNAGLDKYLKKKLSLVSQMIDGGEE